MGLTSSTKEQGREYAVSVAPIISDEMDEAVKASIEQYLSDRFDYYSGS